MTLQTSRYFTMGRMPLALAFFFICIQTVYLADENSENGISSTDFPEKSIDSADSDLNKTNKALHPILTSIGKINKNISSISSTSKSSKSSNTHDDNTSEIGKIIAGKTFPHLPSELQTSISKSSEDESAASESETTVFPITEVGETESEEPSTTQAFAEKPPEYSFAVLDANGKICSLAKFDAVFVISAITKVTVHLPKNATVDGTCEENENIMQLSWPKFNFIMGFSKLHTDDTDEWTLTNLELQYHHKGVFHNTVATTSGYTTLEAKNLLRFNTSIGQSYFCPSLEVFHLYGVHGSSKVEATVRMKEIQLQPFDVKNGEFSMAQRCHDVVIGGPEEPEIQNETVPLAVGLTLAILTLIIVLGFSVHRAYTMRKVDYNGME